MTRTASLIARNLVFSLVVPGLGGGWLPWWIATRGGSIAIALRWEATPVIAAGAVLYVLCVWNFAAVGNGTPGLWDSPAQVVASGPHRWVRNPIYISALVVVLGETWLYWSPRLLIYAVAMAIFFHLFVIAYEEPRLRRRFGPSYEQYRRSVRRWLPRIPRGAPG